MSLKIDLKIFLFVFLFLITSQIEMYIILMIFAIVHELGHLIAGLILRFKPEEIRLTPVGLQIRFKADYQKESLKNNKEIEIKRAIVAFAGPLTNLLISTFVLIMCKFNSHLQNLYIIQIVVYANFLIAMFNLIPIYPMDGGRFLNEVLKIFIGNKKAYKITYFVSKTILILLTALSSILILYIHNIAIIIILAYLWYLEIIEIRRYNRRRNVEKVIQNMEKEKILG